LIPALLIAFALDVGQIVTSWEIREHGLSLGRGVTFFVFAGATYYLQWLYIAHHMPALEIAAGVSATAKGTAISMRDAALWIVPALLPLSTLLYTFSGKNAQVKPDSIQVEKPSAQEIQMVSISPPLGLEEGDPVPFGSSAPEVDGSQNNGGISDMRMLESAGEPITGENGSKKTKTTRIREKK
jgi:hypothetical protein